MIKRVEIMCHTEEKGNIYIDEINIDGEDAPNFRFTDEREIEVGEVVDAIDLANWMVDVLKEDGITVRLM